MARLRTTIPLGTTNDVFGTVVRAGDISVGDSSATLSDGSILIDGRLFDVDTTLRGRGFNNPTSGTLTALEIIINNGVFEYVIDQFSVPLLQASRALDRGNDGLVRLISRGDDTFSGSVGDDIMRSFGGDDTIDGNSGDDRLTADGGNDIVDGGRGDDTIFAGFGDDVVLGGDGADQIFAAAGDDDLNGGRGADTISGQGGRDTLRGGGGNDDLNGGGADDRIIGNAGADDIKGGAGSDLILGGAGRDTLNGGGGDDTLNGNGGRDIIDGKRGDDLLTGGAGRDVFVFQNNAGQDEITDFTQRRDMIDLTRISAITDFDDLIANHASDAAGGVEIALSDVSTLTVSGLSLSALSDNDFLF